MNSFCPSPERTIRIQEALVSRRQQTFADFGIPDDPAKFVDDIVDLMFSMYPAFSVDELLCRPREALRLCDAVRQKTGFVDLPDDIILRPLLNRRKSPSS